METSLVALIMLESRSFLSVSTQLVRAEDAAEASKRTDTKSEADHVDDTLEGQRFTRYQAMGVGKQALSRMQTCSCRGLWARQPPWLGSHPGLASKREVAPQLAYGSQPNAT